MVRPTNGPRKLFGTVAFLVLPPILLGLLLSCGKGSCPVCIQGLEVFEGPDGKDYGSSATFDTFEGKLFDAFLSDLSLDREVQKGQFGAACTSNTDCDSGFCIEGIEGYVCTMMCLDECPEGWVCRGILVGQDLYSLCVPTGADLCKPCKSDMQCGGGKCLEIDGGHYCGKDCSTYPCPQGYECRDVEGGGKQCYPKNGTCDCRLAFAGMERPCVRQNEIGRCLGFETCDPDLGWVGCTAPEPKLEECNGIDDDCDGVADDDPVPPSLTCENALPGIGACQGKWVCRGEAGWDCVGPTPEPESCNYVDDDCDGQVDEDFRDESGKYVSLQHCGACGNSCIGKIPFAEEVACDGSKPLPLCVVTKCMKGYYKASDTLCLPILSSLCVPCVEDANCGSEGDKCLEMEGGHYCGRDCSPGSVFGTECPKGYLCKDFGGGVKQCVPESGTCDCTLANEGMVRVCAVQNEYGTCYGTEVCDPSKGWTNCTASTPKPEICNGLDDDCDGIADDGVVEPEVPCEKTWTDLASGITYRCTAPWQCKEGGSGVTWVCEAKVPGPELCNYQDDNCDGQIDEDYKLPGTNKYAAFDHCGACGVSCDGAVPNGVAKCDASGPQPRCVVDKCDEGYWKASDLACVPFPDTLCVPCISDATCQVPGDRCEDISGDGNRYCTWDCSENSLHPRWGPDGTVCPEGYKCVEVGGGLKQCRPVSGWCDCLQGDAGKTRLCERRNEYGTCYGVETCDPLVGWVGCTALTPAKEVCNGVDDDCNGLTDENFQELGAVCFVGEGECRRAGVMVCNEKGTGVVCDAAAGKPEPELCDGKDNDCDGQVDEDWPNKGQVCSVGIGECARTGTWKCKADGSGLECSATPGSPVTEQCDGKDNDCDGQIDEDWPNKGQVCTAGVGECARTGTWKCKADGSGLECSATPGSPVAEQCDGKDNDCDGQTDENWPTKGQVCLVGSGECQRAGTLVCNASGTGLECNATPGTPVPETCDGKDNDCDGNTDEDWPQKGQVCTVGQGVCMRTGTYVCNKAQTGLECNATPGTGSQEICDYLDNDCDGLTDEDFIQNGKYYKDTACGNCYTDCTAIYNLPHAYGKCDATGSPTCRMYCVSSFYDLNGVPDDGCEFYLDPDAIYVSSSDPFASDDQTCGLGPVPTGDGRHPCKSITYGLSRAVAAGRSKVLVADGLYEETVTLVNGKSLLGGFRQDTWERHVTSTLTVIRGSATTTHRDTFIATSITSPTTLEGFIIYGQVNPNFGGNSYGIRIVNSNANLRILNNVIYAGHGGPGAPGSPGANGLPGVDGQGRDPSNPSAYDAFDTGQRPCNSSKDRWYDNGGKRLCGTDDVSGGRGGGNRCPPDGGKEYSGLDGGAGQPGDGPLGGAGGAGGDAGDDGDFDYLGSSVVCYLPPNPMEGVDGANGAPGGNGTGGSGCSNNAGTVSNGHWVGGAGGNGGNGGNGGGGGGGGAGGGGDADIAGYTDRLGGHGGGGGSGGCGGTGGSGGGAGGASIAIFVVGGSAPTIEGNVIFQGTGGNGGDGGNGGTGGPGGHGGPGGLCPGSCWCFAGAGKGGEGGPGGHGGGGGGGCGGASYGILTSGVSGVPNYCANNSVSGGTGGAGGQGGVSMGNHGSQGAVGLVQKCRNM